MTDFYALPVGPGHITVVLQVVSAAAVDSTHVDVTYNIEARHTNPLDPEDSLNPANYDFTALIGKSPLVVAAVTLQQASPTIVRAEVDEMTNGVTYTVTVNNVETVGGVLIDPGSNTATFAGIGIAPQVSSAAAIDATTVAVYYNEDMQDTAQLRTASRYTLNGGGPLELIVGTSITVISPTEVHMTIPGTGTQEMRNGNSYELDVGPPFDGIVDLAYNELDPVFHLGSVAGIGIQPQLDPVATEIDHTHVQITFSETIDETSAEISTNYNITGGAGLTVVTATRTALDTVVLETSDQASGVVYTIHVENVTDLVGNIIDPGSDSATFTGIGYSPPYVEFNISSGTTGVPVRAPLHVHMYDDPGEFKGIDLPNCWIRVEATVAGVIQSSYAVSGGVIQSGFTGEMTGLPLTADGVTFHIRPKYGWLATTDYSVYAYAIDLEAADNQQVCSFTTAAARCFEDLPSATRGTCPLDAVLSTALVDYPSVERLRRLFGPACTASSDWQVRARTLMKLASMTDLKATLAGFFDFNWVDVSLCDRAPVLDVHTVLRQNRQLVDAALAEAPQFTSDEKRLISRYLQHDSSIYVVNAAALIVVMTAAFINAGSGA